MHLEENKEEFIEIYNSNIKREGSDKLLEWLLKSDFFTAPASTKMHSAFEGGLCEHSIKAYKRLLKNVEAEYEDKSKINYESLAIIGLLHDVCKVDFYTEDMRNVKENGVWVQKPYYAIDDKLPYGHGEKSVYIISGFLRLTREEAMAINWHMGSFDNRVTGGAGYSLRDAFYAYPLALLFHIADMETTYLDETIDK